MAQITKFMGISSTLPLFSLFHFLFQWFSTLIFLQNHHIPLSYSSYISTNLPWNFVLEVPYECRYCCALFHRHPATYFPPFFPLWIPQILLTLIQPSIFFFFCSVPLGLCFPLAVSMQWVASVCCCSDQEVYAADSTASSPYRSHTLPSMHRPKPR